MLASRLQGHETMRTALEGSQTFVQIHIERGFELLKQWYSVRQLANQLNRAPKTIRRLLRPYRPECRLAREGSHPRLHLWVPGHVAKALEEKLFGESGNRLLQPKERCMTYVFYATESRRIKIGITTRPVDGRRQNLERSIGEKLDVLGTLPGNHEPELFERFKEERRLGEWFNISEKMVSWIESEFSVKLFPSSPTD